MPVSHKELLICYLFVACEQVVVRSMPVSSITREKRVPANQHPGPMDQWLNEGLQIRSNTFQASLWYFVMRFYYTCMHVSCSNAKYIGRWECCQVRTECTLYIYFVFMFRCVYVFIHVCVFDLMSIIHKESGWGTECRERKFYKGKLETSNIAIPIEVPVRG